MSNDRSRAITVSGRLAAETVQQIVKRAGPRLPSERRPAEPADRRAGARPDGGGVVAIGGAVAIAAEVAGVAQVGEELELGDRRDRGRSVADLGAHADAAELEKLSAVGFCSPLDATRLVTRRG
jgi:hypothetical protein